MKKIFLAITFISFLSSYSASAQNLVPNPQFEAMRPTSESYNPSMQCYNGTCKELSNLFRYSPAQNWTVWLGTLQNYACVMTELVKASSNCVSPNPNYVMGNMMHVKTTVGGSGIVNSDIPVGKNKVKITCWVYVIKGRVMMGFGPTGSSLVTARSRFTCQWERLEVIKSTADAANQILLYSENNMDSEFYVDAVSVEVIK